MTTYRDIIIAFRQFFDLHRVINTFIDTQRWNFQTESRDFPAVVCVPTTSTGTYRFVNLSFSLFFCDILQDSAENTKDCYNDMLEVVKDFINYFGDDEKAFTINEDYTLQPFEEQLDMRLAGWQLDFTITLPIDHCDVNII